MSAPHINIYEKLVGAGVPLDNHESDLYAKATPESFDIVRHSGWYYTYFTSALDGSAWIEVPFAYYPWWKAREAK